MDVPASVTRLPRVAIATSSEYAELDADNRPLLALLGERGVTAVAVVWNCPAVNGEDFDLVVIRSTWDYTEHCDDFLRWVSSLPNVLNQGSVVRWNADKRYLQDLAAAGLPVVPTSCLAPGDRINLPAGPLIVKPAIGASAKDIAWYEPGQEDPVLQHIAELHATGQTAIIQPYLQRVVEDGEINLVFIGNEYSHAVRRGIILGASAVRGPASSEERQLCEATAEQRNLAKQVLSQVPGGSDRLLYARVDLLPSNDGRELVSEVELIEPCLFLAFAPGSAERLADRIQEAAHGNRP